METTQSVYINIIRDAFLAKQTKNPSYSLRAFARDVSIHPGTLSQIINGKRALNVRDAELLGEKLNLDKITRTRFLESVLRSNANIDDIKIPAVDKRHMIDDTHYQVLAEWEHYAVLELFETKGFVCDVETVGRRLGLTSERAGTVLSNLLESGLLKRVTSGKIEKVFDDIKTIEDVASRALQASHDETLSMAIDKLVSVPVSRRDFSSATYAIDPQLIPEAKTIIREFRMKMGALLKKGNRTEVFQLAIQFFPLTVDDGPSKEAP
jgi:uncharacterized protein (TIGR02147 family)